MAATADEEPGGAGGQTYCSCLLLRPDGGLPEAWLTSAGFAVPPTRGSIGPNPPPGTADLSAQKQVTRFPGGGSGNGIGL